MTVTMCPGQNTAFWKPGDIFDIKCPNCENLVEFFKDEARRRCEGCGHVFVNPKLSEGCAKWCKFADKCLGLNPEVRKELDRSNGSNEADLADLAEEVDLAEEADSFSQSVQVPQPDAPL